MSQRKSKRARQSGRAGSQQPPGRASHRPGPRSLWIAAAALVAAALVGGILAARGNGPSSAAPVPSASAAKPLQLSGTDPISGAHVSLAAYAGKPIVLNVWGSWCDGCQAEAYDLAAFARNHPRAQVIGVDTQDTTGGARSFYTHYGWHHPSIADPAGNIASSLGLQGTPTTFFLDRQHHVVARIIGATNLAGFERGLRVATQS
jgi:thiol-disulfide isomerase/thioredoxin